MDNINVVGIRWGTSADLTARRKLFPDVEVIANDADSVRQTVQSMLFDRRYNQCLVRFKNVLYVCDRRDDVNREFSSTKVDYHPYIGYLG